MESIEHSADSNPKTLKSRIQNGEILFGMSLISFSPTVAEIAAYGGYDFAIVDMEHGFGGISCALPCVHALAAAQTPCIIRIPENSQVWVKKTLDLGVQGIIFPMVEDAESAKKAVSLCRHPPKGVRAVAGPISRASKYGLDPHYSEISETGLLIICQIESDGAAKNVEEIAGVDGVDMIMVGPVDLSASMGHLADPKNQRVKDVIEEVEKSVLRMQRKEGGGPYLGRFGNPQDCPEQIRKCGYSLIRCASDMPLFKSACVEDVKVFKSSKCNHELLNEV